MNNKLSNIASLFSDARSRVIIIFTAALIILALVIGLITLRSSKIGPEAEATLEGAPTKIKSVPGAFSPTEQYAKIVEQQNIEMVRQAQLEGQSAIPTIIRATKLGPGEYEIAPDEAGVGFTSLGRTGEEGVQKELFTIDRLKELGCTAEALQKAKDAGISAETIVREVGCSEEQLRAAGFSEDEIAKAVGPYTLADLKKAGCTLEALKKAKAAGLSAELIMREVGCSADQLAAAGYDTLELAAAQRAMIMAGLKDCSPEAIAQAKEIGMTAQDIIKDYGCSTEDLIRGGFSMDEIGKAGLTEQAFGEDVMPEVAAPPGPGSDLDALLKSQAAQMSEQSRQQLLQTLQADMSNQATQLFAAWELPKQKYVEGEADMDQLIGPDGRPIKPGTGITEIPMIKAGEIHFAILETAVSTDEPGPVMAKIIDGKYKGGVLLGSIQPLSSQFAKKVILTFNIMNLEGIGKTIPISAVAIDTDTARTALATHVDNHYLQRYGTAFAAAFMQGFGRAVEQDGSNIALDNQGNSLQSMKGKSLGQQALIGLGQVGQKFGDIMEPTFSRPPTIFVASGTGLGILFLQDVASA